MEKHSQKSLIGRVVKEIKLNRLIESGDTVIVAVSGGPDSICLLDILDRLKDSLGIDIKAAHFNHKLRGGESDADAEFVKIICRERGIECLVGEPPAGSAINSENDARIARYSFFEKLQKGEGRVKIALAHNANDLVETFLMRLVRGTGLRGLRSIPSRRGKFIRPLLPFSRSEIEEYLTKHSLDYCTDSSNFDLRYTRNFFRLEIIPRLVKVNPNFIHTMADTVGSIEDDYDYLERVAIESLNKIIIRESDREIICDWRGWLILHPSLRRLVLRQAFSRLVELKDITQTQLQEVVDVLKSGVGGKSKLLPHSLRVALEDGKIVIVIDGSELGHARQ